MYYKRNMEVCSRNHFCRGKATSITYSECKFVALVIQYLKRMCRIIQGGAKGTHVFEMGSTSERYVEMPRNFLSPQLRSLRVTMEKCGSSKMQPQPTRQGLR